MSKATSSILTPSRTDWNVYRLVNEATGETEWLGSAPAKGDATKLVLRLGGHQIQLGIDGEVWGVP